MRLAKSNYDVLLFDGYFCDLIITGLSEPPHLGSDIFGTGMGIHAGGTFNMVRALHRLGLQAGWVCNFGNDPFSQLVLTEIRQEGVNTSLFRYHDIPLRALSLSFSFAEDRGFISYMDPVEPYPRAPYIFQHQPRSVLLGSLEYGPDLIDLAEAAHQVGALTCMDCQATSATLDTPGVVDALGAIDIFLPNAQEALSLTGATSVHEASEILSCLTPLVVIKLGREGALARTGIEVICSAALEVDVLDTTAAGDCFDAGFLFSRLRGDPLETSLRIGNICGGLSTTAYGTTSAPTREVVEQYLRSGLVDL